MPDFLLEIGTEEIPAGYLTEAVQDMAEIFKSLLEESRLAYSKINYTGTPRRLVLFVSGIPSQQPSLTKEIIGPRESIAFNQEGKPTEALLGFAKRYQVTPHDVKIKETDKGKVCCVVITTKGEKTELILTRLVPVLITKISFPKSMWWSLKSVSFARPIRYLLALFGKKALKVSLSGIPSGNKTYGHHLINPKPIIIKNADFNNYKKRLARACVMVDREERKDKIRNLIGRILVKHGSALNDDTLLDEVTNLVEYPESLECSFDKEFLSLPEAVLVSAMRMHQRYFPVRDKHHKLLPRFIVITNGGKNKSLVRAGNERVLKARLADAKFFWEKDRKISLASKIDALKEMAFIGRIGSFYDKARRLKDIGLFIIRELNESYEIQKTLTRAAELAKTDLLTEMVGEFPDLQGVMGYEYARLQGEPEDVALAIKEHYLPRSAQDTLPKSKAGIALSLAEKFDNIAAAFTAGFEPTGSADPYAIRRQVLGVIRIVEENNLTIPSLRKIILFAVEEIQKTIQTLSAKDRIAVNHPREYTDKIMDFTAERLLNKYLDEHYPQDIIQAVLKSGFDNLLSFKLRLNDLIKLYKHSSWQKLVEVVERTYNIQKDSRVSGEARPELLKEKEEQVLWDIYQKNKEPILQLIREQKYYDASLLYTKVFSEPVHTFFEKVFVNVEDLPLRNNRVVLMRHINHLYSEGIADLSLIVSGRNKTG